MSKENDEIDFWDVLPQNDKHRYAIILGTFLIFLFPWLGPRGLALIGLSAVFFSTRKPGYTSFTVFFQK